MKITIAYTDSEERKANTIKDIICGLLDKVKLRRSEKHKPFRHIYITTKGDKTDT